LSFDSSGLESSANSTAMAGLFIAALMPGLPATPSRTPHGSRTTPEAFRFDGGDAMMLEPDRDQMEIFIQAMFRHCGSDGFVSLRAFTEGGKKTFPHHSDRTNGRLAAFDGRG
jgi:hypothetical protein